MVLVACKWVISSSFGSGPPVASHPLRRFDVRSTRYERWMHCSSVWCHSREPLQWQCFLWELLPQERSCTVWMFCTYSLRLNLILTINLTSITWVMSHRSNTIKNFFQIQIKGTQFMAHNHGPLIKLMSNFNLQTPASHKLGHVLSILN